MDGIVKTPQTLTDTDIGTLGDGSGIQILSIMDVEMIEHDLDPLCIPYGFFGGLGFYGFPVGVQKPEELRKAVAYPQFIAGTSITQACQVSSIASKACFCHGFEGDNRT